MSRKDRHGFTLIELMLVLVVIGILIGLLSSALVKAKESARKTRAMGDVASLATMLSNYRHEYGEWPSFKTSGTEVFQDNNYRIVEYIQNHNPRGVQFANWSEYIRDRAGNLCDPWGSAYKIVFNYDQDVASVTNETTGYGRAY